MTQADREFSHAYKFDAIYLFASEYFLNGTQSYFFEPLTDYDHFEESASGNSIYFPLVDPKFDAKYFELASPAYERRFETTMEPFIVQQHQRKN